MTSQVSLSPTRRLANKIDGILSFCLFSPEGKVTEVGKTGFVISLSPDCSNDFHVPLCLSVCLHRIFLWRSAKTERVLLAAGASTSRSRPANSAVAAVRRRPAFHVQLARNCRSSAWGPWVSSGPQRILDISACTLAENSGEALGFVVNV